MRTLGKICSLGFFALLGITAGLVVFTSLMVVKMEGSTMLPQLEPGDRVLALKTSPIYGSPELKVGDLVIYEAPYYTDDGEGLLKIRRITGTRGSWIRLNCDVKTVRSQEVLAARDEIQAKVILTLPQVKLPELPWG